MIVLFHGPIISKALHWSNDWITGITLGICVYTILILFYIFSGSSSQDVEQNKDMELQIYEDLMNILEPKL